MRRAIPLLAFIALPLAAQEGRGSALALVHATVLDPATGEVTRDATVVMSGRTVMRVQAGGAVPSDDVRVIDLRGRWVVPGLIDAHTHVASLDAARRALLSGVTTLRSSSVPAFQDVALRELVKAGQVDGPDVFATGVFVTPELGETVLADARLGALLAGGVRTPAALARVVEVNADRGVDWVKTRGTERAGLPDTDPRQQTYDEAQLRAVVDAAAARRIPVQVHAHGDEGAYAAVAAGARSIEHGTFLSDSTLRLMKAKGTYLVPTLSTVVDLVEPGGDYDHPLLAVRGRYMLPRLQATIQRAYALGVPIVTGGDTQYGPNSVTRVSHEVGRFVALGMTPLDALRSATTTAARMLGREASLGRVQPGFEADLLVLDGDPLADPKALEDPLLIVSNGRVVLDRLQFGRPRPRS
jgi:imidazolonepropionase-like amidohydrolase